MKIEGILADFYDAYVYVVSKEDECVIIDAGASLDKVKEVVGNKKVVGLLLTHGHFDHSVYCNKYADFFGCKLYANQNIVKTMSDSEAFYGDDGQTMDDFSRFTWIDEGPLKLGSFDIDCYFLPGHALCCMVYIIDNNLFSGDVLFEKSCGSVSLKFSDKTKMIESLERLQTLEFNNIYSGHGKPSCKHEQENRIPIYLKFLRR